MKKLFIYILPVVAALMVCSCNRSELDPQTQLIDSINPQTDFDKWLEENYRAPYNIRFIYRYEDIQTDKTNPLVPADELYSRILAKILRFMWIDVYTEVGGDNFMRDHAPRVLQLLGSGSWNVSSNNVTVNVGLAEGGQKITLYIGNWLKDYIDITYTNPVTKDWREGYDVNITSIESINGYYLHFIHHEFAHILHQKILFPTEFNTITPNNYSAQWSNVSERDAAERGFVTPYASSSTSEDFVETFATYMSSTEAEWQEIIDRAGGKDSEGATAIERKLSIVKSYFKSTWKIDVDMMRSVMARRFVEINSLDWSNFKTAEE